MQLNWHSIHETLQTGAQVAAWWDQPGVQATAEQFQWLSTQPTDNAQLPSLTSANGLPDLTTTPLQLVCGSFNPVHRGHVQMAKLARARHPDAFTAMELSIVNAEKLALTPKKLQRRVTQPNDWGDFGLLVTAAATFAEKARRLNSIGISNIRFIVGADTIIRVDDPKYYSSEMNQAEELQQLADFGCRFLVFGRMVGNKFLSRQNLHLSPRLLAICDCISEAEFSINISSSELRRQSKDQSR